MAQTQSNGCSGKCPTCPLAGETSDEGLRGWQRAHQVAAAEAPQGWASVAHGAAAFGLPVAGALAGAMAAGTGEIRRFFGLIIGLIAGTAVGVVASRLMGRTRRPAEE